MAAAVKLLAIADGTADEATRGWYAAAKRLSLQESFEQADVKEITAWQAKLGTRVRIARFLLMLEERKSIEETRAVFGEQGVTASQVEKLRAIAEKSDFSIRMRIYYYLSKMTSRTGERGSGKPVLPLSLRQLI